MVRYKRESGSNGHEVILQWWKAKRDGYVVLGRRIDGDENVYCFYVVLTPFLFLLTSKPELMTKIQLHKRQRCMMVLKEQFLNFELVVDFDFVRPGGEHFVISNKEEI